MDALRLAALLWAIGEQPAEALPDLAAEALVNGQDSPALRELAGARRDDFWQLKTLFEATLNEFGIELVDEQLALWRLAQHTASEIVGGALSPSEGAHWIWSQVSHRILREGDLRIFVGLASEWDDHPSDRAKLEASIVDAAKTLLSRPQPRRWIRVQATRRQAPFVDSGTRAEIEPGELGLSASLAHDLSEWAREYDETFGEAEASSGFDSEAHAERFVEAGRDLVARLQRELGDGWHVEYMPEPIRPPGLRLRTDSG